LEGSAIAKVEGGFLVSRGGNTGIFSSIAENLAAGYDSIPARLSRTGFEIDEAEFRAIASAPKKPRINRTP